MAQISAQTAQTNALLEAIHSSNQAMMQAMQSLRLLKPLNHNLSSSPLQSAEVVKAGGGLSKRNLRTRLSSL
jgi:hypothetical protein